MQLANLCIFIRTPACVGIHTSACGSIVNGALLQSNHGAVTFLPWNPEDRKSQLLWQSHSHGIRMLTLVQDGACKKIYPWSSTLIRSVGWRETDFLSRKRQQVYKHRSDIVLNSRVLFIIGFNALPAPWRHLQHLKGSSSPGTKWKPTS